MAKLSQPDEKQDTTEDGSILSCSLARVFSHSRRRRWHDVTKERMRSSLALLHAFARLVRTALVSGSSNVCVALLGR